MLCCCCDGLVKVRWSLEECQDMKGAGYDIGSLRLAISGQPSGIECNLGTGYMPVISSFSWTRWGFIFVSTPKIGGEILLWSYLVVVGSGGTAMSHGHEFMVWLVEKWMGKPVPIAEQLSIRHQIEEFHLRSKFSTFFQHIHNLIVVVTPRTIIDWYNKICSKITSLHDISRDLVVFILTFHFHRSIDGWLLLHIMIVYSSELFPIISITNASGWIFSWLIPVPPLDIDNPYFGKGRGVSLVIPRTNRTILVHSSRRLILPDSAGHS